MRHGTMRQGLVLPALVIGAALVALLSLGTWQLQRHTWKTALIAQIMARKDAVPIPLADFRNRPAGADIAYTRITATGRFDHTREVHLYSTGPGTWGWQVLTPLVLPGDGRTLLVNRGFVPDAQKDRSTRAAGLPAGEVTLTGLVRVPPPEQPAYAPDNAPDRNRWTWIDPAALLQPPALPFVLEAERTPGAPLPNGGATIIAIANNHLGYAFTWYGLAAALAVMAAVFLRSRGPL